MMARTRRVLVVGVFISILFMSKLWFTIHGVEENHVEKRAVATVETVETVQTTPSKLKVKLDTTYTTEERTALENGALSDNPRLVQYIADEWIKRPNQWIPPNLDQVWPEDYSQYQQSLVIMAQLNQRWGGFFVEAGAGNGERLSNTLMMELYQGWSGLLIEPDPDPYRELVKKSRAAFSINACVSPTNRSQRMAFIPNRYERDNGRLGKFLSSNRAMFPRKFELPEGATEITVQCFPLYSMLQAVNKTVIDYLSLDVEGVETDVLRTIPFDKVTIDIMSVEYRGADDKVTLKRLETLRRLLVPQGYREVGVVPYRKLLGPSWAIRKAVDVIFKRNITEDAIAVQKSKVYPNNIWDKDGANKG